jgi:glycosyltransferase A (GT-A) superfamily protein (DUF2064 family)
MAAWLAHDTPLSAHGARVHWHAQAGDDLGARMIAALGETLAAGDVVVLVGSDIPDLPPAALVERTPLLRGTGAIRVVFGPAADGGFISWPRRASSLAFAFHDVTEPAVRAYRRDRAARRGGTRRDHRARLAGSR